MFVPTKRGSYVNVAMAKWLHRTAKGATEAVFGDDDSRVELMDEDITIVEMVPAAPGYECLGILQDDHDPATGKATESIIRRPIIAWGRTLLGGFLPITAEFSVEEQPAFRAPGYAEVFTDSGVYDSEEKWFNHMTGKD